MWLAGFEGRLFLLYITGSSLRRRRMGLLEVLTGMAAVSAVAFDSWDGFNGVARVTNAAHEVLFQKQYLLLDSSVLRFVHLHGSNWKRAWTQTVLQVLG